MTTKTEPIKIVLRGRIVGLDPGVDAIARVEVPFLTKSESQKLLVGQEVSVIVELPRDAP